MGMQAFIDGMLQAERSTKSKEDKQLTLGELIAKLSDSSVISPKSLIVLDTGDVPGKFQSWRGIYAELAMTYGPIGVDVPRTVAEVLHNAEEAVGKTFQGYKGGDFLMRESTPLWLANHGDSAFRDGENRMLTGIFVEPDRVVITTAPGEPYDI